MNILVSNFNLQWQNEDLKNLFTPFGEVTSAEIAIDSFTDKSRGFGHVEMPKEEEARAAIAALHQTEVDGLVLTVREAEHKGVQKGSYKVGSGPIHMYRPRKNR